MGFAEKKIDPSKLSAYRAEYFPYSGPYPWLDRPDALEQIDRKSASAEISAGEAGLCRKWASDGYVILPKLFEHETLDHVWAAYERAVRAGKIRLPSDPAGEGDPFPGRYLNPHKKAGSFCQILKHAGLLSTIWAAGYRPAVPRESIPSSP